MEQSQSKEIILRGTAEEFTTFVDIEIERQRAAINTPFQRFFSYVRRITSFRDIYFYSINSLLDKKEQPDRPQVAPSGLLGMLLKDSEDKNQSSLQFAETEKNDGHPLLNSLCLVSVCSALEALIYEISYNWILVNKNRLSSEILDKIYVPVLRYESLTEEEKAIYIYNEIEKLKEVSGKPAFEKFETILGIFNLRPREIKEDKSNIREMFFVRNAILHKGAVVDERLLTSCPNLITKYTIGDSIALQFDDYQNYISSTLNYTSGVLDAMMENIRTIITESVKIEFGSESGSI